VHQSQRSSATAAQFTTGACPDLHSALAAEQQDRAHAGGDDDIGAGIGERPGASGEVIQHAAFAASSPAKAAAEILGRQPMPVTCVTRPVSHIGSACS